MIILDVQIVEGKKSTIVKNPHVTYTYIQSRQWIALHELIVQVNTPNTTYYFHVYINASEPTPTSF